MFAQSGCFKVCTWEVEMMVSGRQGGCAWVTRRLIEDLIVLKGSEGKMVTSRKENETGLNMVRGLD